MRILLTNDDGFNSDGMLALALELKKDNEIFISAPDSQKSGFSQSFTFTEPLRARKVVIRGLEDVEAYAVTGSPADCARIGCGELFNEIDLVVSGINHGGNMGAAVWYSGTIGAAREAAMAGIHAIAISNEAYPPKEFGACLKALRAAMKLMERDSDIMLLNVNAPDVKAEELKGIKLARTASHFFPFNYIKRTDPRREAYYWAEEEAGYHEEDGEDDMTVTKALYASITPLLIDTTDYETMKRLEPLLAKELKGVN